MSALLARSTAVTGLSLGATAAALYSTLRFTPAGRDPHVWLEEVLGERCLDWVTKTNASTVQTLGEPTETEVYKKLLAILESKEKIPYCVKTGDFLYNFWQDDKHVKGIWRRTTLEEYRKPEPAWELVLDVDALGKEEGKAWVWKGKVLLDEGPGTEKDLCIVKLSDGGADSVVCREFSRAYAGSPSDLSALCPDAPPLAGADSQEQELRRGRLLAPGLQVRRRLQGPRHPPRRHRFPRPLRLHDRLRLPSHGERVEAGHAAELGEGGV